MKTWKATQFALVEGILSRAFGAPRLWQILPSPSCPPPPHGRYSQTCQLSLGGAPACPAPGPLLCCSCPRDASSAHLTGPRPIEEDCFLRTHQLKLQSRNPLPLSTYMGPTSHPHRLLDSARAPHPGPASSQPAPSLPPSQKSRKQGINLATLRTPHAADTGPGSSTCPPPSLYPLPSRSPSPGNSRLCAAWGLGALTSLLPYVHPAFPTEGCAAFQKLRVPTAPLCSLDPRPSCPFTKVRALLAMTPGLRPGRDFHLASAFRSPPASSPA